MIQRYCGKKWEAKNKLSSLLRYLVFFGFSRLLATSKEFKWNDLGLQLGTPQVS